MFERYSEKARRVIFFARYEASQWGSHYIETSHLLLALLREDKHLFVKLLDSPKPFDDPAELMGLEKGAEKISTSVDLPLSIDAKQTLAFSVEEAEGLGHAHIEPAHLLLGLLRVPGLPRDLLEKRGLDLLSARATVALHSVPPARPSNEKIMADLRAQFEKLMARLKPELEPAVSYNLHREKAK